MRILPRHSVRPARVFVIFRRFLRPRNHLIPCRFQKCRRNLCYPSRRFHSTAYGHPTPYPSLNGSLIRGHTRFPCLTLAGSLHRTQFPFRRRTRFLTSLGCLWIRFVLQLRWERCRHWNVVRQRVNPKRQSGFLSYRRLRPPVMFSLSPP
jgi:hypothetical protein